MWTLASTQFSSSTLAVSKLGCLSFFIKSHNCNDKKSEHATGWAKVKHQTWSSLKSISGNAINRLQSIGTSRTKILLYQLNKGYEYSLIKHKWGIVFCLAMDKMQIYLLDCKMLSYFIKYFFIIFVLGGGGLIKVNSTSLKRKNSDT